MLFFLTIKLIKAQLILIETMCREEEIAWRNKNLIDAFYSDARKSALQVGDHMPALLINPAADQAIVFWERANGNIVYIDLNEGSNVISAETSSLPIWSNGEVIELNEVGT